MQIPKMFGECLSELLRSNRMSIARLTQRMNYRSSTSIARVLRDEVRYGSIQDFMARLERAEPCIFNQQEIERLREAMEVSRLGRARYQAYRQIWHLLNGEKHSACIPSMKRFGAAKACTLGELAEVWRAVRKMEMILINAGEEGLFSELERLFRERPDMDCSVRHYLTMRDEPGVMAVQLSAVMKVIHDARYQAYYRTRAEEGGDVFGGGERCSMAVVWGEHADGSEFFQVIYLKHPQEWMLYENGHAEGIMPFVSEMLECICHNMLRLKVQYPRIDLLEGLTAISQRYLSYERDRNTWCLAPNVCFELIPVEIMYQVMFDSVLKDYPIEPALVETLCGVHRARYENIHGKKKEAVFVFLWESMLYFAQTGRTTDHIAGMRAFTAQERRDILRDLVKKCRANESLKIYILRPEVRLREMTMTAHEGLGVYLLDSFTQYDVLNGHSEAFVVMPSLVEMLQHFFQDELIEKCAFSKDQGLAMLEELAASIED